jgi:hypothetical protein
MKWLGFGSRPDWQHGDGSRRAAAVATLDAPELLAVLPEIARSDDDPRVRRAAIERLEAATLYPLCATERDPAVREAIDRRLLALAIRADSPPEEAGQRWLGHLPAPARIEVARTARDVGWRRAALSGLDRPALLVERCLADPDPRLRLELLERIDAVEVLDRIAREARRRDKRLARAAADRALAARVRAGDPSALRALAIALCERLTELRAEPADRLAAGLADCESQWRDLEPRLDPELAARVAGHLAQARAALVRARGIPAGPAPDHVPAPSGGREDSITSGATAATPAPADDDPGVAALVRLVDDCAARRAELDAETLDGLVAGFEASWRALAGIGPAARAARRRFEQTIAEAREAQRQARADQAARERARRERIAAALADLEHALDESRIADARAAAARLDEASAGPGGMPRAERSREAAARQRLADLLGRQRWSLNRQRAELCDAAEALPGQSLHPDAVASRVRELREAWERIDAIARAAGDAPDPESGLARRFRALSSKALAPTRRYFAERQRLRAARAAEFDALARRDDQDSLDDRALALRRREIASALRRLDEVEASARAAIGRRLRAALARVDAARSARAESSEAARRRLLASLARRLARVELAEALAIVREAEQEWTRLPRARADVERALRAEFDALAAPWREREQSERSESRARQEAIRQSAETILRTLEAMSGSGADPATLEHRIAQAVRDWRALDDSTRRPPRVERAKGGRDGPRRPPERAARPPTGPDRLPTGRFEAALAAAQSALDAARAAAEASQRARRANALGAVRALEAAAIECARADVHAATSDAVVAATRSLDGNADPLPADLAQRRDAARAVIDGRSPRDAWLAAAAAAAGEALGLALRAECCAGIASPPEHAEARRRIQVARLEARMREGHSADPAVEIAAIERAWEALAPLESAVAAAVGARIESAAAAIRAHRRP